MFFPKKRIKILSTLGEGLNANVFKVSVYEPSLEINQTFAMKVLKRSEDGKHFKTEFHSLLKAHGKRIVRYCGWETYKSKPAILLEHIDGVTLSNLLQNFSLTEDETRWIYNEALEGLKELEDSGLFHGDLSPHNIMVDKGGNIKLIDFGLTHWRTQKIELTPEFAAKSVLNGGLPSFESDLVSLKKIFSRFKLQYENTHLATKPQSIIDKVVSLKEFGDMKTSSFPNDGLESSSHRSRIKPFSKLAFLFTSFLFITPVTAKNYSLIDQKIVIRSSKWLAVKMHDRSNWCYTPCEFKVKRTGAHLLTWKSSDRSGVSSIYVNNQSVDVIVDTRSL
jgi:serine/threonine protein kinase